MKPISIAPSVKQKPSVKWILFAVLLTCLFIILQLPAGWVLSRIYPKNQNITAISGNLWHGEASWTMPAKQGALQGTLTWHSKPWQLLLLRLAADVEIQTGSSKINTEIAVGKSKVYIQNANGDVGADTLRILSPITWPDTPIHLKEVTVKYSKAESIFDAAGQLNYNGGDLGYPFEGKVERASLPPLVGLLSMDKNQLHFALTNSNKEKMGDVFLSPEHIVDIRLTQRLLLNVAGYKGQAGLDTAVVSLRQPLASLGTM